MFGRVKSLSYKFKRSIDVTARENLNRKHLPHSSKYTGVHWHKYNKKWASTIVVNRKHKFLGHFNDEYDAHIAYEKALSELNIKTIIH